MGPGILNSRSTEVPKYVFGLGREQLTHNGRVFPAAVVLSHAEQLEQLRRYCPEALPVAVVAGDPCYDRLLASLPRRRAYREALGLAPDTHLIVMSSTWGRGSLLGRRPDLAERLLTELPADEYRIAAVVHPNIWYGHGPWQVRAWLADAVRAGLILVPPREGWRAALVASDLVIGDHGSVTVYGAALGRPVLMGAFDEADLDPTCPAAELGRTVPLLLADGGLRDQIDRSISSPSDRHAAIASRALAVPGRSNALLAELMYRLMGLDSPGESPPAAPVPEFQPEQPKVTALLTYTSVDAGTGAVELTRFPAALRGNDGTPGVPVHLAVDVAEPDQRMLQSATVLARGADAWSDPELWAEQVLEEHPSARLACASLPDRRFLIRTRDRHSFHVAVVEGEVSCSLLVGSGVYGWRIAGQPLPALDLMIRAGASRLRVLSRSGK